MKHLLNNPMLETETLLQHDDSLKIEINMHDQESKIEDGNLQDYLEIYGEKDDIR